MSYLASFIALLLPITTAFSSFKHSYVIAVIDTGFGYNNLGHDAKLCKYGHKDFSVDKKSTKDYGTVTPVPVDFMGHGTNVLGLIQKELKGFSGYCFVVIKAFDGVKDSGSLPAIKYATNIGVDLINYSAVGDDSYYEEQRAIDTFRAGGGVFVASAGNNGRDLDKNPTYPAYYPGVIAVGALGNTGKRSTSSNYGQRLRWEPGIEQEVWGLRLSGTSMATAIASGKIAKEALSK